MEVSKHAWFSGESLLEQLGKFVVGEAGLLDDATNDVSRNIETGVKRNSDSAGLGRVFELYMRTMGFVNIKSARYLIALIVFPFSWNFGSS